MPLADGSVLPVVLTEEPLFSRELEGMVAAGRRGTPYRITDAIRAIAQDAVILGVVEEILGGPDWVMWGANIRRATPNEAQNWHVDLERLLWPKITVAIGLAGCPADSATCCVAGSQKYRAEPPQTEAEVLAAGGPEQIAGFGDGRLYVFDARVWHPGEPAASGERVMLFLTYPRADQLRIPLLVDYYLRLWAVEASPYFSKVTGAGLRRDVAPLPLRYRVTRWMQRCRGLWAEAYG